MASVDKRTDGRPKPWIVRWRDEEGKQRKKSFARKLDADRFRAEVEHSLNTGSYIDPVAGKTLFRAYAEEWRLAQAHRTNTAMRTKSQLHRHVYPVIGDRPMASLRESQLQAVVNGLDLAASSLRPLWATVNAILGAAVRDRIIGRNPGEGVKLPELPIDEIEPLLIEQVDALADAVPKRYRGLVVAVAGSGLRQGEAFGLEVPHIDFLRKTIKVEQQIQPAPGGGVEICRLKNRYSYRPVPVGQVAIDAFAAHLAEFPAREVEVMDTTGRRPVKRMAQLVFIDDAGKALYRNDFNSRIWSPARKAAGIPESGMHDLRHFFASLLIRAGLNPKVVAKMLGHKDAAMTLRVYAHLWPDDEDRSREAVDAALRRADVPHLRPVAEG